MKKILIQYKPFFTFLVKFFASYLALIILYSTYLNQFDASRNELDSITKTVASNVNEVLLLLNQVSSMYNMTTEPAVGMRFNGKIISRVVEGCNAISLMLLFMAFVIAFSSTLKKTSLYIGFGLFLIYVMNITRIALLNYALYYYPEQRVLLHDILFPLVIYGIVFLLWVIWVLKFSNHAKKQNGTP